MNVDDPASRREWLARVGSHPAARETVRSWRRLTGGRSVRDGGRRTLVACSGGADSTALALALGASAAGDVVMAHVRHDLRPTEVTLADERTVGALAGRLGLGFVRGEVRVAAMAGNVEGNARRARYAALESMARDAGCLFVATGHQGDDQLETMLMRLLRGAGPRGLAGMAGRRRLGAGGVDLVRPMLGLGRSDSEELCRTAGVSWCRDATNADRRLWRARLREEVVPVLRAVRADVHVRAGVTAGLLREAAEALEREAGVLLAKAGCEAGGCVAWAREDVAVAPVGVLGEALRRARVALVGMRDADRLRARDVVAIHEAIADPDGRSRVWEVAGVRIELDPRGLTVGHSENRADRASDRA